MALDAARRGRPIGTVVLSASAPTVFISYRRDDSAGHAGRLYDALAARFGDRNVFMDVDLAPGIDFVERITEAVNGCDVLLVVIGPRWARITDDRGAARLAVTDDFVRLEVETALRRPGVNVIPLLVAGARMPNPDELPESVRALSRRNALELSDLRWRHDVGRLLDTLEHTSAEPEAAAPASVPPTAGPRGRRTLLAALLGALVVGIGVATLALAGVFAEDTDPPDRGLTTDDAVERVRDYERAFEARDLQALRRLLDPDVVLKKGNRELEGSDAVIEDHRRDFRSFGGQQLAFDWEAARTDANEENFEVDGPYVISAGREPRVRGELGVLMQSIGSRLLITELCFGCPDLEAPGGLLGALARGGGD